MNLKQKYSKMMNYVDRHIYAGFLFLFAVLFIVVLIIGYFVRDEARYFTIVSLVVTSVGLSLGYVAYHVSKSSANAQFLSVISKFEDRRIDIVYNVTYLHVGLWKALVDMDEAMELNLSENINRKHLRTLTSRYNGLMKLVVIPNTNDLLCEDIRHVLKMYKYVFDLNVCEGLKAESEGHIRDLFGLNDDAEIHKEYADILLNNITDSVRWNNYLPHRIDIIG